MNLTFTEQREWAIESPIELVEGSTITISCTYNWGAVSSVSAKVYRRRSDYTSTCMPSGSVSTNGSVATLKPLTSLVGDARYVVAVTGTVGGDVFVKKIEVIVTKDERER